MLPSRSNGSHHFYVSWSDHQNVVTNSGFIQVKRYTFSGRSPVAAPGAPITLYKWAGVDPGLNPYVAVDSIRPTFTDIDSAGRRVTQTDPTAGEAYVAWNTNDTSDSTSRFRSIRTRSSWRPRPTARTGPRPCRSTMAVMAGNDRDACAQAAVINGTLPWPARRPYPGRHLERESGRFRHSSHGQPAVKIIATDQIIPTAIWTQRPAAVGAENRGVGNRSLKRAAAITGEPLRWMHLVTTSHRRRRFVQGLRLSDARFFKLSDLNVTTMLIIRIWTSYHSISFRDRDHSALVPQRVDEAGMPRAVAIAGANLGELTSPRSLTPISARSARSLTRRCTTSRPTPRPRTLGISAPKPAA